MGELPDELHAPSRDRLPLTASGPRLLGQDITVQFKGVTPLAGISYDFGDGDYPVAVTGPSGSGKTTLLRVLGGLHPATSGLVLIDGLPVRQPSWRSASDSRVGFVHQDYRLVPFLTVGENLRLAWEARRPDPLTDSELNHRLDQVSLSWIGLDRLPKTLSGGEQQRVAIARTLLAGCTVLLADEPTGALDEENTKVVADLLGCLGRDHGVAVVIATHDPQVSRAAEVRYRLNGGSLCRQG